MVRAVDELNASLSDPLNVRGYKLDLENNKTFKTFSTPIRENIRCPGTELQDNPDLGSSACKLRRSPESLTTSEPVPTHRYNVIKKLNVLTMISNPRLLRELFSHIVLELLPYSLLHL